MARLRYPKVARCMIEQLLASVREGAAILTANQRLARGLRRLYDDRQAADGKGVWPDAPILPFSSWLRDRWTEAVTNGIPSPPLLSADQQLAVWRRVIDATSEPLLQIRATAAAAIEAWSLVHEYELAWSTDRFAGDDDSAAFRSWARAYHDLTNRKGWTDEARLPDLVLGAIESGAAGMPPNLLLAGFDEMTPRQTRVIDTLAAHGCRIDRLLPAACPARARRVAAIDSAAEIRSAARWARALVERDSAARIGVVIPALEALRDPAERIFTEVLHPERLWRSGESRRPAFHVSKGKPLADYPAIWAALSILDLDPRGVPAELASRLLRSPFIRAAESEASARAAADARLRRRRLVEYSMDTLVGEVRAPRCPAFLAVLDRIREHSARMPKQQTPPEWAGEFDALLDGVGWPGPAPLDSAEYQTVHAWRALLARFAATGIAVPALSRAKAVARLREMAADTEFQPQDEDAPVQIMGALEAAGSEFDHLWILGLHDEVWPGPAHPHPFLPIALQRERNLPHCSSDRELEFVRRTMERLLASAPDIVVSYPQRDGDRDLRPSALIAGIPAGEEALPNDDAWTDRLVARSELESLVDETAPPLDGGVTAGGASVLKHQAACPFRAFARIRLGAQPTEEAALGMDPAARGIAVHRALECFWRGVRSHAEFAALSGGDLDTAIRDAVREALDASHRDDTALDRRLRRLEEQRMVALLGEWLNLERARQPFRVMETEARRDIAVGGLEVSVRVDRLDELDDGRQIVIDYKATAPSLNAWLGDRPDEPQVPLYSISANAPIAAAAFVQITPGAAQFRGFAEQPGILPGVKALSERELREHIAAWRSALTRLAGDFRNGRAEVDPKNGHATCERCGLDGLCRIGEDRDGAE
jgi:ATP-dependent helicase/nuclease subunit B